MEANLNSASDRIIAFVFLLVGAVTIPATGCVSAQKASQHQDAYSGAPAGTGAPSAEVMGPPEPYGPPAPEAAPPAEVYGPEPMSIRPVVLVLGPGMARGFAYVGALRALSEAKIPIGAVLGTEMGSLIGGLYAVDGNINHFEWALLRFKDDVFGAQKSILPQFIEKPANGKRLENELRSIFSGKDLSEAKIPVRVAIQPEQASAPLVLDKGGFVPALRSALAVPELYSPGQVNGVDAVAAAKTRPFLINEAKALSIGPVVVLDVMKSGDEAPASEELKQADLVIRPDMNGIDYLDFQKRTDAAFRGKSAVKGQLAEIRHLVGLPPADPGADR